MTLRTVILLFVALLTAGGTALLARGWLTNQRVGPAEVAAPAEPEPVARVLVAASDLPTGTFLTEQHLRWQSWPDDELSDAYVVEGDAPAEDFHGSVVRLRIAEGEPITAGRVVRPGERGFLAAVLEKGMRAVTVKIDDASGVAGFVFPGDRVDLVMTHSVKVTLYKPDGSKADSHKHTAGETVLRRVRVLAIDQETDKAGDEPAVGRTATLEVAPHEAEVVMVAARMGQLSLALRALRGDGIPSSTGGGGDEDPKRAPRLAAMGLEGPQPVFEDEPMWPSGPNKRSSTQTWDSEISPLISPPWGHGPPSRETQEVRVIRGSKQSSVQF